MSRRDAPAKARAKAKAAPRMSHEQAADLLVDYHFGRLPPKVNAAVEAHVRTCSICQRQGLEHAATERREVLRVRVRPTKPLVSRKTRIIVALLLLAVAFQLAIFELVRPDSPFSALLRHSPGIVASTPDATPTPAITTLRKSSAFDVSTAVTAVALSPDGKTLAGDPALGPTQGVALWDAATGKQLTTLTWPGAAAPAVLAWSPDGSQLAAADGSSVGVLDVASKALRWQVVLPSTPAARVYDATDSGNIVQRPSADGIFAQGQALKWGDGGQLTSVPASTLGAPGFATPSGQVISLWQASGSHLFKVDSGVSVGFSQGDQEVHRALLGWSPDGHYLFWTNIARGIDPTGANAGLAPPDSVVGAIVGQLASSDHADAMVWVAADGKRLASCTRAQPNAPLDVYDIAAGRVVASLPGACDHLASAALAWSPDGSTLFIAVTGAPVTSYVFPAQGA